MTGGAIIFDHEQRCDSIIEEGDLARLQKEINHNIKKQERTKRNLAKGLRPDGTPLVRGADNAQEDNLLGNIDGAARQGAGGPNVSAEGFNIPISMRNYQEREILRGFAKLRKYERIDLFWGRMLDVDRDMLYMHGFIMGLTFMMYLYIIGTSYQQTSYIGNI